MPDKTIALYDQDAYLDCFSAVVLSCDQGAENGRYRVILDQTCFFPEQGGQSADTGWINDDVRVLDAKIRDGVIEHLTDQPLPVGASVRGKIDFERRFVFMQHHTGEHIFSGLVFNTYGFHNVGFHLSERTVSMDYDGCLSAEQVRDIEWKANQIIWRNVPVLVSWPDDEALKNAVFRSKKEISGRLRLVTIPDVDVCACCAPHVQRTGEIGQLRVVSAIRYKGGTRLQILCGGRALIAANQDSERLSAACQLLSCSGDHLHDQISALLNREKETSRILEETRAEELMKRVKHTQPDQPHVVLSAGQIQEKTASAAADLLLQSHSGICGIIFEDGKNRRVVLVSKNVPLRAVAQKLRSTGEFKGGGDDGCIRGMTAMDDVRLEEWLIRCSASQ